ncbi:group 1 glycosyl transferase [Neobacillus bataviensis LMG 21833]|uniref:Group 1 glycosyl transferase n=1 Tax=Neobacillus bataviensis LMG 21833 TaxID=1117379 RepID=K6DEF4_9BACI|nr:glycosyltransferase family 4 protein [Neobacillus bataviensis]EKN66448.1 group 1 glycosyl transferase [Neobacillus bataviensis LMG 21833]
MKAIYFTTRPPYPPHKGDQLIAYEQIKQLKDNNVKVYLISFVNSDRESDEVNNVLGQYCEKIYFLKMKKITMAKNLLKTAINFRPLQVNLYTNNSLLKKVKEISKEINPDIIHVQTVRLGEYFIDSNKPKVLDMIDALSLNMARRANKETPLLKKILQIESKLLQKYEKKVLESYQKCMLVSENDKNHMGYENIVINPNGTFITKTYLQNYKEFDRENTIVFHGNMNYFPNIEATMNFTKNIWPKIHLKYPNYKLYIVGKDPSPKIQNLDGSNNIVVTGFVEDICQYLCKAKIGVYPMYSGTGMQNKILEALACGLPIVATPLALQGVEGVSENEVVQKMTDEELFSGLDSLICDDNLRTSLSKKGQHFVFTNYSWSKNTDNLIRVWKSAIESKK